MRKSELIQILQDAVISGAETLVHSGFSAPIDQETISEATIESFNIIPSEGESLNKGIEINFTSGLPVPGLHIIADVEKKEAVPGVSNVGNVFELLPTSLVWNRLFGVHKFNHIGIDIVNNSNEVLSILSPGDPDNTFFKSNTTITIPASFTVRSMRIYFIYAEGGTASYRDPGIIIRILGRIIHQYLLLMLLNYKNELSTFVIPEESRTSEHALPSLFNLASFINYYDTLEVTEPESSDSVFRRKLFLQRILKFEEDQVYSGNIQLDVGSATLYFLRTEYNHDQHGTTSNIVTSDSEYIRLFYADMVQGSPEKCFCAKLQDIPNTYIAVFDASVYQFDQLDITTSDLAFTELAKKENARNCKGIINGSFWGLEKIEFGPFRGSAAEVVGGLVLEKASPQGHYIFRDLIDGVHKRWSPGDIITTDDEVLGTEDKIVEDQRFPYKCYFYQTEGGELVFERGTLGDVLDLVDRGLSNIQIAVGCDNLVGYMIEGIDITTDPDFGRGSNLFLRKNSSQPHPDKSTKGFPLFGTLVKNNKQYLFFLVAEDPGFEDINIFGDSPYLGRPDRAYELLKDLGATNVMFTDGASSAALIYDNHNVVEPSRLYVKDVLIATGIGIQPREQFPEQVVVSASINAGGPMTILQNKIILSTIPEAEKQAKAQLLVDRRSMPFISHLEFPQHITSEFKWRDLDGDGVPTFHEGVDIRAQTPLNIRINRDGVVFKVDNGNGFGKFIIINHGRDLFRNYYFTLYAHLSTQVVAEGQNVVRNQVIGTTGNSGTVQFHLHFELMVINKELSQITYQELLPLAVHLDPASFVLPEILILE